MRCNVPALGGKQALARPAWACRCCRHGLPGDPAALAWRTVFFERCVQVGQALFRNGRGGTSGWLWVARLGMTDAGMDGGSCRSASPFAVRAGGAAAAGGEGQAGRGEVA